MGLADALKRNRMAKTVDDDDLIGPDLDVEDDAPVIPPPDRPPWMDEGDGGQEAALVEPVSAESPDVEDDFAPAPVGIPKARPDVGSFLAAPPVARQEIAKEPLDESPVEGTVERENESVQRKRNFFSRPPKRTQEIHVESVAGRIEPAELSDWPERFVAARELWDERVSGHIKKERVWQKISFACLVVTSIAVIGVVTVSNRMTIVPHIVEVDRQGTIVASYGAHQIRNTLSDAVIKAGVTTWLTSFRTVSTDPTMQGQLLKQFESYLDRNSPAYTIAVQEIMSNSPLERSRKEVVYPEINEIRKVAANQWYVLWS